MLTCNVYTVEPPNEGHFGENINPAVVSFVEMLSVLSSEVETVLELQGEHFLGLCPVSFVDRSIILYPYLGGSTTRGSTVCYYLKTY